METLIVINGVICYCGAVKLYMAGQVPKEYTCADCQRMTDNPSTVKFNLRISQGGE